MAKFNQIYSRTDIGYYGIGLHDVKNGYNVGGVLRAIGAFGGKFLAVSGNRWSQKGDWRHMDTEGAHLRLPVYLNATDMFTYMPYGCEPVAIELSKDARSIVNFKHPKVAMYIFGPEDGSLPDSVLEKCKSKIYIPTEYSLNLYSAATAVMYDRVSKISQLEVGTNNLICPNCGGRNYKILESAVHCNACGNNYQKATEPNA